MTSQVTDVLAAVQSFVAKGYDREYRVKDGHLIDLELGSTLDPCAITVDAVVAAAGLRPETALARRAGLEINRGVVVDSRLRSSHPAIFALGDCAEINGMVLPFLQPILLSAMCLSKNLLEQPGELKLPPMLVKVKTPDLPLHLAGDTRREDLTWNIVAANDGLVAKGVDAENQLRAFVVSEDRMKEAFALLKQLVS